MSDSSKKVAVLSQLKKAKVPLSLPEISALAVHAIPERTLRRWLVAWVEMGDLKRTGKKRGTRYQYTQYQVDQSITNQSITNQSNEKQQSLQFLTFLTPLRRTAVLEQIRDLWTHTSTALEGNTLTLGDTHAILGLGLTVSGKPLREHHEILGHAKAIELIYQSIVKPLDKALLYSLHKAIQAEIVNDIFKPMGAWKVEINGTNAVTSQGEQLFIEYAHPMHVDDLMEEVISTINKVKISDITTDTAINYYAKIHMAIAHIHPFWDGNGRIARLLANILLLKAGLPPLVIEQSKRREYIECLADYQVKVGQLTNKSGVWPDEEQLADFEVFCGEAYEVTLALIEKAGD